MAWGLGSGTYTHQPLPQCMWMPDPTHWWVMWPWPVPYTYIRVSQIKTASGYPATQPNPGDLTSYAFTYPLEYILTCWQCSLNLKLWFWVSYQPFVHESHCPCNICWKEGFVFFSFPSPEVEAVKESGLSEQEPRARCKVLSERKQMSFHPFSGGEMSGTITGATYGNRQQRFSSGFECLD